MKLSIFSLLISLVAFTIALIDRKNHAASSFDSGEKFPTYMFVVKDPVMTGTTPDGSKETVTFPVGTYEVHAIQVGPKK